MTEASNPFLLIMMVLPLVGAVVVAAMGGAPVRTVKLTALVIALVEIVLAAIAVDRLPQLPDRGSTERALPRPFTGLDPLLRHLVLARRRRYLAGDDRADRGAGADRDRRLLGGEAAGRSHRRRLLRAAADPASAMIGVFAATDVFVFYVMFEVMLIPMYFLIGEFGGVTAGLRRDQVLPLLAASVAC